MQLEILAGAPASKQYTSWEFDIMELGSPQQLVLLSGSLFADLELPSDFSIPPRIFASFISAVHQGMSLHTQAYFHNFWHSVDVAQVCVLLCQMPISPHSLGTAQTVFLFLTLFKGQRLLTKLEQFGLMVAALCHDLEHPGMTLAVQRGLLIHSACWCVRIQALATSIRSTPRPLLQSCTTISRCSKITIALARSRYSSAQKRICFRR